MNMKPEKYKGYNIKFKNINKNNIKMVIGEYPSKITGRILGTQGSTKDFVFNKCKQMIDKELKIKGIK